MNTNVSCFKWTRKCWYKFQNMDTTSENIERSVDTEYFRRPSHSEFLIRSIKGSFASKKVGPGLLSTVRISSNPMILVRIANAFICAVLVGTSRMLSFKILLKTRSASSLAYFPSFELLNETEVERPVLELAELRLVLG